MAKLHGAAKAAFLRKMAAGRRKARAPTAKKNPANPPRKRAKRKASARKRAPAKRGFFGLARAKRNPPAAVVQEALSAGAAAILGGLIAHALVKVSEKIASPGVASVAGVALPVIAGAFATQMAHKQAQAVAAGMFGVAGGALAGAVADAIARPNPPMLPSDFWVNPPVAAIGGGAGGALRNSMNAGYRDGVTAYLLEKN